MLPRSVAALALFGPTTAFACTVALVGPAPGAVVSTNPTFQWSGDCGAYRVGFRPTGSATTRWVNAGATDSFQLSPGAWATVSAGPWVGGVAWAVRGRAADGSMTTTAAWNLDVNRLPTAPGVIVTPGDPVAGLDDLLCEVAAPSTDADGDPVAYAVAWEVDGAGYPGPGDTGPTTTILPGDTVPGADVDEGDTWTCAVTPSDPYADGPSGSAALLIGRVAMPDFTLEDVNATSTTAGMPVSPRDYLTKVSGWYFGHAT